MIDPKELKYTKDDEWVRFEGEEAFVGITDYAQSELGDLVFVNLPEAGDEVVAGEPFGDVESVKGRILTGFRSRSGDQRGSSR